MLYQFIIYFLIGIVLNILWIFDMSFIIIFLCPIVLYVLYIKDILKDNVFYVFIMLMSFMFSYFFIQVIDSNRDLRNYTFSNQLLNIEGRVVEVSPKELNKIISIETISIKNLSNREEINQFPKYLSVAVSPLSDIGLYDQISLVGEIQKINFNYSAKIGSREEFINSKNSEKLFLNIKYTVSNLKKIEIIKEEGNIGVKKYWIKIKKKFYETSENIQNRPNQFLQDPYLGIAKGISYGSQENIHKDIKKVFIDSGLIHIMVLSGANVSFIILILFYFLKFIPNISQRFKVYSTLIFSFLFVLGTGLTAPSLRASLMVNVNILSEYFSKNFNSFNSLILSLFILTLVNPYALLYSPSLHLSYLAVSGLLFLSPFFYNKFDKIFVIKNNFLKIIFSTFLGILLSVGPYLLALSGQINLPGIVVSMLLEPVIMGVTILTFLITIFSYVSNFLTEILAILNSFLLSIILNSAEFLAQDIFIIHTQINLNLVRIYYLLLIIYIYYSQVIKVYDEKN